MLRLAFAPFIVFALVDRVAGPLAGFTAGALVSLILLARDWLFAGHSLKILDLGTAFLFAGLLLYWLLAKPTWSVIAVRLCVDSGLLLIVLASMAVRRPFMMQYAREQVKPELYLTADKNYSMGEFLSWLWKRQIAPHIPVLNHKQQTNSFYTQCEFIPVPDENTCCRPDRTLTVNWYEDVQGHVRHLSQTPEFALSRRARNKV